MYTRLRSRLEENISLFRQSPFVHNRFFCFFNVLFSNEGNAFASPPSPESVAPAFRVEF